MEQIPIVSGSFRILTKTDLLIFSVEQSLEFFKNLLEIEHEAEGFLYTSSENNDSNTF